MARLLPKITKRTHKRLGRGIGSGKGGHTSSRGQKGQKTRDNVSLLFEGVKVRKSLIKRLPLKRGKEKFRGNAKPLVIKLSSLNVYKAGEEVTIESLAAQNIVRLVDAKKFGVKVLDGGKLEKKLTVKVPVSKSVAKLIEKAGGKLV